MNILAGIRSGGWAVFGAFQIFWAVQEFRKFGKFRAALRNEAMENNPPTAEEPN